MNSRHVPLLLYNTFSYTYIINAISEKLCTKQHKIHILLIQKHYTVFRKDYILVVYKSISVWFKTINLNFQIQGKRIISRPCFAYCSKNSFQYIVMKFTLCQNMLTLTKWVLESSKMSVENLVHMPYWAQKLLFNDDIWKWFFVTISMNEKYEWLSRNYLSTW